MGKAAATGAADAEEDEEEAKEEEASAAEARVEGDEEPTVPASLAFPLTRMKRAIKDETNMLVGAGATTSVSRSYTNDQGVVANLVRDCITTEATVYLAAVMGTSLPLSPLLCGALADHRFLSSSSFFRVLRRARTAYVIPNRATVWATACSSSTTNLIFLLFSPAGPACECARAQSMLRITPRHVQLAIRNDQSLSRFFADAVAPPTLPTGLAGAAGALPGLPSLLPSFHVPPAAVPPTEAQAPVAEPVPGLRRALAAAGMERCDEGSAFFANPPQAALPALAAVVAAFEISQDVDELKDTLTHTRRYFSTS